MRALIFIALVVALWVFLGSTLEWVAALAGLLMAVVLFLWFKGSILASVFVTEGTDWRRPGELAVAVARYLWVVALANLRVALLILRFRRRVQPAVLRLHTGEMGDLEQTILANSITLTPGTITIEFSPDRHYLYVHVLDVQDIEVAREQLQQHLEVHFGKGLRWWMSPLT